MNALKLTMYGDMATTFGRIRQDGDRGKQEVNGVSESTVYRPTSEAR